MNDFLLDDPDQDYVEFDDGDLKSVYNQGYRLGQDVVEYNYHDIKVEAETSLEEFKELVATAAYEAEDNYRQYSPFEFTAKEFNDADNSDEVWAAYEDGIGDGINAAIEKFCTEEELYIIKDYTGVINNEGNDHD